jgi:hypothetical protein
MATILTQPRALRISWGAVFAGVVLSLVSVMILNLLGAGIGASALAPLKYQNPLHGFGYATGAWLLIVSVIAIVIGSYLAGRCAPVLGWLHGILAWGVMTILVVYMAFSLAGSALNAVGNVAAVGANVAGQMAGSAANGAAANGDVNSGTVQSNAQSLVNAASQQLQQHGIDPNAQLQPQADAQLRVGRRGGSQRRTRHMVGVRVAGAGRDHLGSGGQSRLSSSADSGGNGWCSDRPDSSCHAGHDAQ